MAIGTYSDLKASIKEWMARDDISDSKLTDIVTIAEARLNRKLKFVKADVPLTGTSGSRVIDISSYSVIEPIALFIVEDGDEREVIYRPEGTFPQTTDEDEPGFWTVDGDYINFDCELDQAYTFRFRYAGRFGLSDASPTNDLLTEHPDVYLAACIVWGGVYIQDTAMAAGFKVLLDEFIDETQYHLSLDERGVNVPDPVIAAMNRYSRGGYNGTE